MIVEEAIVNESLTLLQGTLNPSLRFLALNFDFDEVEGIFIPT